ncbi:hypothetical protein V8G54_012598 [Vigna mungo]|uniref:Pentatricopeptide repeat-containing protein n=1 Tax=Vigna mungo TaxID=3915 RepID=A0AAQ3S2H1_VIGMU
MLQAAHTSSPAKIPTEGIHSPPIYDDYNESAAITEFNIQAFEIGATPTLDSSDGFDFITIVDFNADFNTSAHTECVAIEVDTIAHSNTEFTLADSYIDVAVYDFESVHHKFYVVDHIASDLLKPIAYKAPLILDEVLLLLQQSAMKNQLNAWTDWPDWLNRRKRSFNAHSEWVAIEVDTISHSNIKFKSVDSYIDITVAACFDFAVYYFESVQHKFYVVDHMCLDLIKFIADTLAIIVDSAFVIDSINPPSPDHDNVHEVVSQFLSMFYMRLVPPIYAFGQILGSLTRMKHYSITISLFKQMELKGIQSNLVILNILINCFCHLGQLPFSFSLLAKILKGGYHPNVITLNTLMKGLCLNSEVKKALTFHERVLAQGFRLDEISYGILINGLCKVGETQAAIKLLRIIEGRSWKSNVVMYACIIDSLLKHNLGKEAYNMVIKMMLNNIMPNVYIYNIMIDHLCKEGKIKEAKYVLGVMVRAFVKPDIVTLTI